jgi:hypothetical protein
MSDFKSPGLVPTPDLHGENYPSMREYHHRVRELEVALEHADRLAKSAAALLQIKIGDNRLEMAAQQLEAHVKYYQEYRAVLSLGVEKNKSEPG